MKVKYLIYFFTFALMSSFALFISDELLEANTDYRDNQLNLYKITRAKEISEAFQATLLAHRLKRLSLINPEITPAAVAGRRSHWRGRKSPVFDPISTVPYRNSLAFSKKSPHFPCSA